METFALIPAAGLSSRMGSFKPMLPFRGKPLIISTIQSCLDGGASFCSVALGHNADTVREALAAFPEERVKICVNPDYKTTDMFQSILLGLRAIPRHGAFYVLPADMPAVPENVFCALAKALQESGASCARPLCGGRRGHPILLSGTVIPDLESYTGSGGLKHALLGMKSVDVPVFGRECLMDADTPEDYKSLLELE